MLDVQLIPVRESNYIFLVRGGEEVAVVDPGEADPVIEAIEAAGGELDHILLTHHHGDHTDGVRALRERYDAAVYGNAADADRLPKLDAALEEGNSLAILGTEFTVIDTPGHTVGHIAYHSPEAGVLFCGDTLFTLGCGRVFEGSMPQMWDSLSKLAALPPETTVYCAHEYTQANARFALTIDPDNAALVARAAEIDRLRADKQPTVPTTLSRELETNPFLRPADAAIRALLGLQTASDAEVFAEIRRRKDAA